jgi:hypothetical protein
MDDLRCELGDDRAAVVAVLDEVEWALDTDHPYRHYERPKAMSVRAPSAKILHGEHERVRASLGARRSPDVQRR